MTVETIETDFRLKVGQSVRLVSEGVNRYRVFTPFLFEDGDHLAVVLKREDGRWVLSDEGHTYTHLTYDIDEKDLQKGNRQKIISNALSMFSVENREGELRLLIPDEQYGDGLFNFIQALLKISDVSYLSRDRVKSIFLEEFRGVTEAAVPVDRRSFDWHDPQHDPAGDTGAFSVKSGADKRPVISREEVQRMLQSADLGHADRVPVEGSTVADVDLDHFRTFFEKHYGEPLEDGAAPLTRLLENLNLAKASTLNLAGRCCSPATPNDTGLRLW